MSSKYFKDEELACHCCGELPPDGFQPGFLEFLDRVFETVFQRTGAELSLSCAYRCPDHNADVGGVPNSQHVQGCAADILCPDCLSVDELADIVEECGADGIGRYYDSSFVHADTRGYAARWTDHD